MNEKTRKRPKISFGTVGWILVFGFLAYQISPQVKAAFGVDTASITVAPSFELPSLDGQTVSLEAYRGQVVLVNPNGILFGNSARVDVGSLVASGLAVSGGDFESTLELSAQAGTLGHVVNRGIINAATGGAVALVGKRVVNEGVIQAQLGSVSLAGGREAVLTFDEHALLGVRVVRFALDPVNVPGAS